MKAWKFTEPYQAKIVDVEQPVVSEGNDVVVELKATGILGQ